MQEKIQTWQTNTSLETDKKFKKNTMDNINKSENNEKRKTGCKIQDSNIKLQPKNPGQPSYVRQ